MTRIRRTTTLLIVSLIMAPSAPALASDEVPSFAAMTTAPLTLNGHSLAMLGPLDFDRTFADTATPTVPFALDGTAQWYRRGGRGRRHAAVTAIMLGAVGTIAGTAVLVYANRPDCGTNPNLGGCGYGTKVVGGAVLAAGLAGIFTGALLWH
jgi:hypothetical protein